MKRALWFIVLCAGMCAALFAQNAGGKSGESKTKTYKIGDIGPAGGIIFYDRETASDSKADGKTDSLAAGGKAADWRYLEAAPAETEFAAPWGAYGVNINGTGPTVGSGKGNTQLIVERLRTLGESKCAAQLCAKLSYNGFTDWFLPSKDELDLMYKNLKKNNLGKFSVKISYWSSSQANNDSAWYQSFDNGKQYNYGNYKYDSFSVRAVRSF
jgi:hypothetical protein